MCVDPLLPKVIYSGSVCGFTLMAKSYMACQNKQEFSYRGICVSAELMEYNKEARESFFKI